MIVEFLEVTFIRHGTCKLLYDTSLALARSSPTRRYTGTMHVSTSTPRFYILGTAELIVLKFVT